MIILKKSIVASIALLLCFSFVFAGCGRSSGSVEQESTQPFMQSDNNIVMGEDTSVPESELGKDVTVFMAGKYYIDGTIYTDGQAMPMKLATDGNNVEMNATYSNINVGFLYLDDKTYIVIPQTGEYTELNETLLKIIGIDSKTLSMDEFTALKDEKNDVPTVTQYNVTINGEPGLCSYYTYDDTIVRLYSIGDKLIQIENYDANGTLTMQIAVNSITSEIPSNQMTLKGRTEVSALSFSKKFTSAVAKAVGQQ